MTETHSSSETKSTIRTIFLTLFLDLMGFSIIFPLFPKMISHYQNVDPTSSTLNWILSLCDQLTLWAGPAATSSTVVIFGGILGALYSLLQFVFAPIWGSLSDRVGRKPVLLISLVGTLVCYIVWFFAHSFTLLVISRIIGGVMAGNISTASAVIGDVTTRENRSRGMAAVGIAFGMGFLFGPAIGGLLSLFNLMEIWPSLVSWGINPFSSAALFAVVLSSVNIAQVIFTFKESLPPEKRGQGEDYRTINPLKMLAPLPDRNINLTNLAYFTFLVIFSGMEFTLTFLAAERFGYEPKENSYLFIYIGFIMAFVQGGVVRRSAHKVGEGKMAAVGLCLIIPGLVLMSKAFQIWQLYLGLGFIALGGAMVIPCLTSLVSLFASTQDQGKALGIFRSLGALARVLGPLLASLTYWRFGSSSPYFWGALGLFVPALLILRLGKPSAEKIH